MKRKVWLWILAALPLIGVPLIAQQARPEEAATPAPTAPTADAPPAADTPEPAARESSTPADERLSTDNSLSFPVDI